MTALDTAPAARPGSSEPVTMPAKLLAHAARRPRAVALRQKRLGLWQPTTWAEYARRSAHIGAGLVELGVEPGDSVAVHSDNRMEWLLADLGIQGIGAVTVGVYPTNPAPEVGYVLGHSHAVVLMAEDEEQLDKALEVRDELPGLRKIVVIDPRGIHLADDEMVMTFEELEALGRAADPDASGYARRVDALDPEAVATIVYTSGTTGPPKGAMLTHANLQATAHGAEVFETHEGDEVLSYLPLCHVAERVISVVDALHFGYVVNFGESPETFTQDLREVQPTFFLGVPRVWEKMLAAIETRMGDATRFKRWMFRWWTERGASIAKRRMSGARLGIVARLVYRLGWLVVFRPLREKLGLARVRLALSGAAPIAPQVLEFFWTLGIPILEVYGQTESSGIATIMPDDAVKIGAVGTPFPGVEVKLGERGEILVRGPNVFRGYFRDEGATRATIDDDGWLHTGDIGEFDDDGYLWITDRMKDIIITAGGKNISPQYIENHLKVSPYVREAIVIGDGRPYLTALIGIEIDTVGDWATRHGLPFTTYGDLAGKPEVRELIGTWVDEVNERLAQVERVKRFEMLDKELDEDEGELTPTMKVKRRSIAEAFGELIDGMYR